MQKYFGMIVGAVLLVSSFSMAGAKTYQVCGNVNGLTTVAKRDASGGLRLFSGIAIISADLNAFVNAYSENEEISGELIRASKNPRVCVVGYLSRGPDDEALINVLSVSVP